jgi:putative phosphoribosyl transferase
LRGADILVLALPRGGVPVAFEIAVGLGAPLDVQLVRKVGAPGNPEFGIGAVADGAPPVIMIDEELVRAVKPPAGYVEAEVDRELAEMTRRRERYVGDRPLAEVAGRTVILVDDGIATGGTARAALAAVRRRGAARIILAAPVAAAQSLERLREAADHLECLLVPDWMTAVGNYYSNFRATSDDEVTDLLAAARRHVQKS